MAENSQRIFILVIVGVFLLSTIAFTGLIIYSIVGGNDTQDIAELDDAQLQELADLEDDQQLDDVESLQGTQLEGFEPITDNVAELQVTDIEEGDGAEVQPGDTVVAHYTGAFAVNGVIFESSLDGAEPVSFPLDGVIEGWQEGVPGMREGGVRRIVIPAEQAYGQAPEGYESQPGQGSPLGPLVFDIQLFSIE